MRITSESNYKSRAPEGGWGYVIAVAFCIILVIGASHMTFFGILFEDFLSKHGNKMEGATIAATIYLSMYCFIGLLANHLIKKQSCRFVALLGGFLVVLASFSNIFCNSYLYLYITYGAIQGCGIGILFHSMYRILYDYFVVRRNFIIFVCQTVFGAVNICMPYFMKFLKDNFGFRGTLLILCSINSNVIPAALAFFPVKWHNPKEYKNHLLEKLNANTEIISNITHLPDVHNLNDQRHTRKNISWRNIYNFLELSLLKDPLYLNICFGLGLTVTADIMFATVLPTYLQDLQYNSETVAYLMTIFTFADFIGRLILSIISVYVPLNNRYLLLFGVSASIIGRIVFTSFDGEFYWGIQICIVVIALLRCSVELTYSLILAEYSDSRFNAALAMFQILYGILSLSSGAISKLIISLTNSNIWVINMYTICMLITVILWLLEFLIKYCRT